MTMLKPSFWEYLIIDTNRQGPTCITGIREDAPEQEKEKYKKWMEMREKKRKQGIKL